MVIKVGDQPQMQKALPQKQLTREQNDKWKQSKPLLFKRKTNKDQGVNVHPRSRHSSSKQ